MNYKSPLCSCIVCHKTKSAKGIFSHYLTSHTEYGRNKILSARDASISLSKEKGNRIRDKNVRDYLQNTAKCTECNQELHYDIRHNKFCDHSCAASFNNKLRNSASRQRQIQSLKKTFYPNSRIKFLKCDLCKKVYTWHKDQSKLYCSVDCKQQGKFNKQSELAKTRGLGGVRRSIRIKYNGISLGSTYELKLAKSLDDFGIKWNQPPRMRYVDPSGKSRTYEADFYLPEYNVYLDPKNDFLIQNVNPQLGFRDTEKIRLVSEQNNVRIIILDKSQLSWESVQLLL